MPRPRKPASPFRYFNSSPEVIRLVVMMSVRFDAGGAVVVRETNVGHD